MARGMSRIVEEPIRQGRQGRGTGFLDGLNTEKPKEEKKEIKIKKSTKEDSQDDEDDNTGLSGTVMIDNEYYFKVGTRCYTFGKRRLITDKDSPNYNQWVYNDKLYPTTIESVFKCYFKEQLDMRTKQQNLTIEQLLKVVEDIKSDIKRIADKLEYKA